MRVRPVPGESARALVAVVRDRDDSKGVKSQVVRLPSLENWHVEIPARQIKIPDEYLLSPPLFCRDRGDTLPWSARTSTA